MAATPQYGTMTFVSALSNRAGLRRTYIKDVYLNDVANNPVRFDGGNGAGTATPTELTFPEPVILVDYSQVTGTVDTTKLQLTRNGMPTGDILRYTIHLTSLNNRPRLSIGVGAGVRFGSNQLT